MLIMDDKIKLNKELEFSDVYILPQHSLLTSRKDVDLERHIIFNNNQDWTGIPIVSSNMDTTGTFQIYNVFKKYKMLTALNKFYTAQDYLNAMNNGIELDPNYFMVTTGITKDNLDNLISIVNSIPVKWICVDVANGYMECFIQFCKELRQLYPDKIIVAGNVVTKELVARLVGYAGVDVVKIGIGSGSACLTRRQTGIGRPQLSAIIDCYNECVRLRKYGYKCYIISDGGIKYPSDMAKAFVGGADFVMAGGVFAGHDENPGDVIIENGQHFKMFYGMSSKHAMEKYFGHMEEYRSSEGAVLKIPYKGSIEHTISDFLGGLRSTCTYVGAHKLEYLCDATTFCYI